MSGTSAKEPLVRGWCPGAYRPMVSGDGLVVRVRPWMGELSIAQTGVLCDLADQYGTGSLELTSRANVQIRGVAEGDHGAMIAALQEAGLLDDDPTIEGRRNVIMTPEWVEGDETHSLAKDLLQLLPKLPELPTKFGYAIDTGASAWVRDAPADIRLERDAGGGMILVADGSDWGVPVTVQSAMEAVQTLVDWFVESGGREAGRMERHLRQTPLPEEWATVRRRHLRRPTHSAFGAVLGVPFGQMETKALRALVEASGLETLRVLPGRTLLAKGSSQHILEGFCAPDDPILSVHACTGAPGCSQALGQTRRAARALVAALPPGESLHVSGCAKGCAFPRKADWTFVATKDGFDLVRQGRPWDAPVARGIPADALAKTMTSQG